MIEFKKRMPKYEKIPILSLSTEELFKLKKMSMNENEISVNKLRHAKLIFKESDEIVKNILKLKLPNDKRTNEILDNTNLIEETSDYEILFSFLSDLIGNDAITLLIKKLRAINISLYKHVLSVLREDYNDIFMENALLILSNEFSEQDISSDILNLLKSNNIRDPMDFSSFLLVLGHSKNIENLNVLYSFYIFFKDNFPENEYFEGPLLAIKDICYRLD
jgi:hypothetical protein